MLVCQAAGAICQDVVGCRERDWGKRGNGEKGESRERTIIKSIEHVQEHRTYIPPRRPILPRSILRRRLRPGILFLEGVPAAPDGEGQDEENDPQDLCFDGAALHDARAVEGIAECESAHDLTEPVEHAVEGAGANVEAGGIDVVELVLVEPVAADEHGEEQQDPGVGAEDFEEPPDLRLPARVLHEDDVRAVGADDVAGVDQRPG